MIDEKKLIEDIEKEFDGVCTYDVSPSRAVQDFTDIVDRQPKVGVWIPVSERLPEKDGQYWITENWGGRRTCLVHFVAKHHISFEEFLEAFEIDAVAWKPAILPEPYKAGEHE